MFRVSEDVILWYWCSSYWCILKLLQLY